MRNIEPPAKSKMAVRGTQNGQRGLESGPILGYWGSDQLSLNKFFDPSTPSMRKGRDGEKRGKKMVVENNDENSGPLTSLPTAPAKIPVH